MPTALIVEDEPAANKLLSMLVQLRGYQPESAYTGGEALAKVDQRRPDVVFLDLMLPDTNGYEVCSRLKADRRTSLIPIVMVTARLAEENRIRGFQVGADEYIPKPYTPDQIFQALAMTDAWRRALQQGDGAGALRLDARGAGQRARELSRLRSLLRARTPLDEEAIARVAAALEALWTAAGAWGRAQGRDPAVTLAYEVHPDHVALTLRDEAGWLEGGRLPAVEGLREADLAGAFDEVRPSVADRAVVLTKRFPAGSPPPAP
jgi:DNA-binding response OmpR family regulator